DIASGCLRLGCFFQFVAGLFPSIALVCSACSLRFLLLSEISTRWRRRLLLNYRTPC
ncbi:unnamed protein product, partial [Amoebophrya sp. A25]